MVRTCQRFVTYTLDLRLRMAAHIYFSYKALPMPEVAPIMMIFIELFLFVLLGQSVLPFALNWPYVVRHLPLQYVGSRPSTAD